MHTLQKTLTKASLLLLVITLITPAVYFLTPQRAEAVVGVPVVEDGPNLFTNVGNTVSTLADELKEWGLDKIAFTLAKAMIRQITADLVNWINSGFEGGPAFVSSPQNFITNVGDQVVGDFIDGSALGFLCDPFKLNIQFGFQYNYAGGQYYSYKGCTLTQVIDNVDGFVGGNFSQGGWDGWFTMFRDPLNNPYGSQFKSEQRLYASIQGEKELNILDFQAGNGFLSQKKCVEYENEYESGGDEPRCLRQEVVTPGSVISEQLNNNLGSGVRQLELADELDEIVDALMAQLVNQIITGGGLAGSSKQSPSRPISTVAKLKESDSTGLNAKEREVVVSGLEKDVTIRNEQAEAILLPSTVSNPAAQTSQNVAFGTIATQSSVYVDKYGVQHGPEFAVDGDKSNQSTITNSLPQNWLEIELKEETIIDELVIYQNIGQEFGQAYIIFTNNDGVETHRFDSDFGPPTLPQDTQPLRIQIPNALTRKIRILKKPNAVDGRISLKEIEAYNNVPPVIKLNASNPYIVNAGDFYVDPGAQVTDKKEGDITHLLRIGGDKVVTSAPGSFTVTYNATDAGGASAEEVRRIVHVR